MTAYRTVLRLIAFVLFLAGLLLLQKPIFGQTIPTHPPEEISSATEQPRPIVDTCALPLSVRHTVTA
jgi:hypothetical protein